MRIPFVGSAAVTEGHLSRSQLRTSYRPIYRGIYVPARHEPTLRDRIVGASLATGGVIAGVAASAWHGASWVDADTDIEVVSAGRPQRGLVLHDERITSHEITCIDGVRVTTRARTAFDLARRLPRDKSVARLDALMHANPFAMDDVYALTGRNPRARGLPLLRKALPLVDGGAESPRETWLRLLFIDAGLPKPTTQFVLYEDRRYVRRLDMVWAEFKVGAEYDGAQHLASRAQYAKDVWAARALARLDWHIVHVIKEDDPHEIVNEARAALLSRGWRP
ncbi:hypothetical protein HZU40_05820 [Mycolicibacterium fluoranthenivorans]|uniref:DUF559 domain-containing protein n=1 Tax=Mycolicibacterium fluoranthenivorans TaxID=258505 RepID=A0A7G8PHL4_9MYCO|nr:hypothetical protein HZU40_05820 [Mycolicibacterium fluoranthenivorans]